MDKKSGIIMLIIVAIIAYTIYWMVKQFNLMVTGLSNTAEYIVDTPTRTVDSIGYEIGQVEKSVNDTMNTIIPPSNYNGVTQPWWWK